MLTSMSYFTSKSMDQKLTDNMIGLDICFKKHNHKSHDSNRAPANIDTHGQ